MLALERGRIDRVNAVDEAITFATLPAFRAVSPGEMVATVKIIPYAVPRSALEAALAEAAAPLIRVAPFKGKRVAVLSTLLPGLKPSVVSKTLDVLAQRLAPAGGSIVFEERVAHETQALAEALPRALAAGPDIVIVFGASAISDRRDVIPAAVEAAGGRIEHLGMPVDPGNLLLLAAIGEAQVVGAPGCARSTQSKPFSLGLRAQPQGERLRLGAAAPPGGPAGGARRGRGDGRRRPPDGDQDAATAARRAAARVVSPKRPTPGGRAAAASDR